jgi:hypothetical protein
MSDSKRNLSINIDGLPGLLMLIVLLVIAWWVLSFFFGFFSMSVGRLLSYVFVFSIGYCLGEGKP